MDGTEFNVTYPGTIITNPPYMKQLPQKFINHGMSMGLEMYLLLRLSFLEGKSLERCKALDFLKTVYVFKNRLPRMHRDGYTGKTATSLVAFAWFHFSPHHKGDAVVRRIEWDKNWKQDEKED